MDSQVYVCRRLDGIKSFKKTPHYRLPLQPKCYNPFSKMWKYVCVYAMLSTYFYMQTSHMYVHFTVYSLCVRVCLSLWLCLCTLPFSLMRGKWLEKNSNHWITSWRTHTHAHNAKLLSGRGIFDDGRRQKDGAEREYVSSRWNRKWEGEQQRGDEKKRFLLLIHNCGFTAAILVRMRVMGTVLDFV